MKYFKYAATVIASVTLIGCSSFLDETPDQRTEVDTPAKAKDLLVYAYPSANSFYVMEAMSDNFGDSKRTQNTAIDNTKYFRWETEQQESWDSPAEFWESSYLAIAHANHALQAIEEMSISPKEKNEIRGEALLSRAYNHWMIAMLFCEAYDPTTAGSKLGIPYVNEPERTLYKDYERGTLQDVYNKLEADIIEGNKLVTNNYKQVAFHFTKNAGKALATRFFAVKGDWDKVLEYSDVLGDAPAGKLRNYVELNGGGVNAQGQLFGSASMPTNLLISGSRTLLNRVYRRNRFAITREILVERISSKYNPFGVGYSYDAYGSGQDVFYYPRFFEYFVYSNQSAGSGQPYVNIPLLTQDEWYLYRIEATIMKGDLDKAARMIGFFAKYRTSGNQDESTLTASSIIRKIVNADEYQPFYSLTTEQRKMFKFVSEMRRTEFMHLGNRWYDVKRFNLPVVHKTLVEGETLELQPLDPRKAVQLPISALSANLTPNPRD